MLFCRACYKVELQLYVKVEKIIPEFDNDLPSYTAEFSVVITYFRHFILKSINERKHQLGTMMTITGQRLEHLLHTEFSMNLS